MDKNTKELGVSQLLLRYYEQNDEVALTEFLKVLQNVVFRVAYSVVHNQADADDLMQQTFIKIIQKESMCQAAFDLDDTKVKSWVLSIVYNYSRMHLRSKKTKLTYQLDERIDMPTTEDKLTTSLHLSENSEINQKVKLAIFNLSEKYRVPLLLRYLEDMSIEDISKTLATNPSTIRSNLKRGLDQLRNKLSTEKMVLSSTAAIDLLANVSMPVSSKAITPNFIKACCTAKATSTKLATYSTTKSSFLLKTILALTIIGGSTVYFFNTSTSTQTTTQKTIIKPKIAVQPEVTKPIAIKTKWDFSKENGSDIKVIKNKIIYKDKLNAITNQNIEDQNGAVISLGVKSKNYTKIITNNVMLLSDFTSEKPIQNYIVDFAPLLDSEPVSGFVIYRIGKPIDFKNVNNNLIPYNQDIYIIDNLFVHFSKGHGIIKIFRFDEFPPEVEIGLVIENVNIQKISIEPMEADEIAEIKNQVKSILEKKKKSTP